MAELQNYIEEVGVLCRLCLSSEGPMISIHNTNPGNLKTSIAGRIFYTTSIKVRSDDSLPSQICWRCHDLMNSFLTFKLNSTENNRKLSASLKKYQEKYRSKVPSQKRFSSLFRTNPALRNQLESLRTAAQPPRNNNHHIESVMLQPYEVDESDLIGCTSSEDRSDMSDCDSSDPLNLESKTCLDEPQDLRQLEAKDMSRPVLATEIRSVFQLPSTSESLDVKDDIIDEFALLQEAKPLPTTSSSTVIHPIATTAPRPAQPPVKGDRQVEHPTLSLPNDVDVSDFLEITMDGVDMSVSLDTLTKRALPPKQINENQRDFVPDMTAGRLTVDQAMLASEFLARKYANTKKSSFLMPGENLSVSSDNMASNGSSLQSKFERQWMEIKQLIGNERIQNLGQASSSRSIESFAPIPLSPQHKTKRERYKKDPPAGNGSPRKAVEGKPGEEVQVKAEERIRMYKCTECEETYPTYRTLIDHVRGHGTTFACSVANCGKTYFCKELLDSHLYLKHKRVDCDLCYVCGKTYKHMHSLLRHLKVHYGEADFKCNDCIRKYTTKSQLEYHIVNSHLKLRTYTCEICHRTLTSQNGFRRHMRVHNNPHTIKCELCPKTFTFKTQLQRHILTHTGETPHKCVYCGREFSLRGNYQTHLRLHTGVKPYICEVCGKGFTHNVSRKNHMKHHLQEGGEAVATT